MRDEYHKAPFLTREYKLKYVLRVAVTTRAGGSDGPEVPEFPEGAGMPGGPTGPTGSTENNIIFYKQRNFVMLFKWDTLRFIIELGKIMRAHF